MKNVANNSLEVHDASLLDSAKIAEIFEDIHVIKLAGNQIKIDKDAKSVVFEVQSPEIFANLTTEPFPLKGKKVSLFLEIQLNLLVHS